MLQRKKRSTVAALTSNSSQSKTETLSLSLVATNGGTQSRAQMSDDTVADYASEMQSGTIFPPVIVYYDGESYHLGDGFHRVAAAKRAGRDEIEAEIRQGTRRDAILHSVGANATHGLRRTNADKRRAVLTLLRDDDWQAWSNREIARRCRVSSRFVDGLRKELEADAPTANGAQLRTYERNGQVQTMKVGKIGGSQKDGTRKQQVLQRICDDQDLLREILFAKVGLPHVIQSSKFNKAEWSIMDLTVKATYKGITHNYTHQRVWDNPVPTMQHVLEGKIRAYFNTLDITIAERVGMLRQLASNRKYLAEHHQLIAALPLPYQDASYKQALNNVRAELERQQKAVSAEAAPTLTTTIKNWIAKTFGDKQGIGQTLYNGKMTHGKNGAMYGLYDLHAHCQIAIDQNVKLRDVKAEIGRIYGIADVSAETQPAPQSTAQAVITESERDGVTCKQCGITYPDTIADQFITNGICEDCEPEAAVMTDAGEWIGRTVYLIGSDHKIYQHIVKSESGVWLQTETAKLHKGLDGQSFYISERTAILVAQKAVQAEIEQHEAAIDALIKLIREHELRLDEV